MKSARKLSFRVREVRESGIRRFFDLAQGSEDAINFGIGEPDFDTPEHVREAGKDALDKGYTHYTPNAGYLELREELAKKLKRENNVDASPEEVVVTAGGTAAIFLSMAVILDPGDEVLIPDPGFLVYEQVARALGCRPVGVPLGKGTFDFKVDELEKKITRKTKCVVINSPSNPTGTVIREKTIRELANLALQHGMYILSDEVYEKFVYDGERHFSVASVPDAKPLTITINSFSKTYAMCGWRVGYAFAEKPVIDEIVKLQQCTFVHASSVAQKAALAALRGPQDHVRKMVEEYDRRRRTMVKLINEVPGFSCLPPKGAFYAFPSIEGTKLNSFELAEKLLREARVVTVPGAVFGGGGEGFLRLAYTVAEDKIEDGLRRIQRVLSA